MSEENVVDRRALVLGGSAAVAGFVGAASRATSASAAVARAPRSTRVINVKDYGARGDGVADDSPAIGRALLAVSKSQARIPMYFPAGSYRTRAQLRVPSNTSIFGDGSGRSWIHYTGLDGPALIAGSAGGDWSDSEIRGIGIRAFGSHPPSGYGLQVINPTNSSTVGDVSVFGFQEGQILVDNGGQGPGPNFFRLSGFFVGGGRNPLRIVGGRQTVLVEYGGVDLDDTANQGVLLEGGEAEARTLLMTAVKVEGSKDVPGFKVTGLAPCTFVACARHNGAGLQGKPGRQPAFLYSNPGQPSLQVELIACTSLGVATLFSAPDLGVRIPGDSYGRYSGALLSGSHTLVAPFSRGSLSRRSLTLHKDVHLSWTDESGSSDKLDVSLYRASSNTLKTDDQFVAAGAVTTKAVNGPPTDATLASAEDGSLVVDTKNARLYVRIGGSWRWVQLG